MLNKEFWKQTNEAQAKYDQSRRQIIGQASNALHLSKQAIFAMHRDNVEEAEVKLVEAEKIFGELETKFSNIPELHYEGAWTAAREEFVEAKLFWFFVKGMPVGEIPNMKIEPGEYLGGLSDYTGELLRRAVLRASKRKFEEVDAIAAEIGDVIEQMLAYNLTGLLRTKFDQAKKNMHRIEQMLYEINLKSE
jgi:predicted translin family RNA/ssDNA-binding protein